MSAVYIALPIALLLALAGVAAFIWSVRSGQLDDLETPALRVLAEEDERQAPAVAPTDGDSSTDETSGDPTT
jgi:cbb3-type cytochrome oxidase maturation protein